MLSIDHFEPKKSHESPLRFVHGVVGNPFDQKNINNKLDRVGREIGIERLSFTIFATAATLWLKADVPVTVVRIYPGTAVSS